MGRRIESREPPSARRAPWPVIGPCRAQPSRPARPSRPALPPRCPAFRASDSLPTRWSSTGPKASARSSRPSRCRSSRCRSTTAGCASWRPTKRGDDDSDDGDALTGLGADLRDRTAEGKARRFLESFGAVPLDCLDDWATSVPADYAIRCEGQRPRLLRLQRVRGAAAPGARLAGRDRSEVPVQGRRRRARLVRERRARERRGRAATAPTGSACSSASTSTAAA